MVNSSGAILYFMKLIICLVTIDIRYTFDNKVGEHSLKDREFKKIITIISVAMSIN